MIEKEFIMEHEVGLHARPAARFTKIANYYKSEIRVIKDGKTGNGKSLLSILALGIFKGNKFKVQIAGPDEKEAMREIERLVKNNFKED